MSRPELNCRVERRACDTGGERAWGDGSARGVHGDGLWGDRARAERTWNMFRLSVTLDVSKLSAWLNADAYCRVERRARDAGCGAAREA